MLCIVVVFQLPTLLESDCFSAIVFFATQMSIFVFLPIINFLVGLTGLEPVTPRLSSACSNQLSYRPGLGLLRDSYQRLKISYQSLLFLSLFTETGGGTGTRTPDIQLAKLALYQLSYTPSCGSFRKKAVTHVVPAPLKGEPALHILFSSLRSLARYAFSSLKTRTDLCSQCCTYSIERR